MSVSAQRQAEATSGAGGGAQLLPSSIGRFRLAVMAACLCAVVLVLGGCDACELRAGYEKCKALCAPARVDRLVHGTYDKAAQGCFCARCVDGDTDCRLSEVGM